MKRIQQALKDKGYNVGPIDGIRGRQTILAIKAFQIREGLFPDGIVGSKTSEKLFGVKRVFADSALYPWVAEADRLMGTKEVKGPRHDPTIMGWAERLGLKSYTSDEIAWCGLFMGHIYSVTLPDEPLPANILGARQWLKFGRPCKPVFGSCLIFYRGDPGGWQGHVGNHLGETAKHYIVGGGNQRNMVCKSLIKKDRLLGSRWPITAIDPATMRTQYSDANGLIATTNEA